MVVTVMKPCRKTYRMVVVRKNISRMKGDLTLLDEFRYFFYITTRRDIGAAEVVRLANARRDQENVIAQLKAAWVRCGCRSTTWRATGPT